MFQVSQKIRFLFCVKNIFCLFFRERGDSPALKTKWSVPNDVGWNQSNNYSQNLSTFHPIETLLGFDFRRKQHIILSLCHLFRDPSLHYNKIYYKFYHIRMHSCSYITFRIIRLETRLY